MRTYFALSLAAALPVVCSVLLYLAQRLDAVKKMPGALKQTLYGLIFGALAVYATETGVDVGGALINARDAAPLCAGLLFGAPAGIIAGVIGGAERWLATLWGAGAYTRLACTIATCLAGFVGAGLNKYIFEDEPPRWFDGLAVGAVMEIVHMLLVFLTNIADAPMAYNFVRQCVMPMTVCNAASVMLAVLLTGLLRRTGQKKAPVQGKRLSNMVLLRLLLCVSVALFLTTLFVYVLETGITRSDADKLLRLTCEDVRRDIMDGSDGDLLRITRAVAHDVRGPGGRTFSLLSLLQEEYDVAEIDMVDNNGIIVMSTNPDFIGFDMASGEQSSEFLTLLDGETQEYVQPYQPISYDASITRKYAGVSLGSSGFVQVAYDYDRFRSDLMRLMNSAATNRHVGEDGYVILCDENRNIINDGHPHEGEHLRETGLDIDLDKIPEGTTFEAVVDGVSAYCMYFITEGCMMIGVMPKAKAMLPRNVSVYLIGFLEIIVFAALFVQLYFLIRELIVKKLGRVNQSLSSITGGDLDVKVDVHDNVEFASLSDDINETVTTLKRYIADAAARIDRELEYARRIQVSALPGIFPPYPGRTEFDIYATMDAAKEVGGDFYDFYFVRRDMIAFLVADVSGKGIPAALFMMTAKTLIKGFAESGLPPQEVFTRANEKLVEANETGMFVTGWMGCLDLVTGQLRFANAGHNPPLIREGGQWRWLRTRPGFVMAGMEGTRYRMGEITLSPGDAIFLYTDGVTEACDREEKMFGEERLLETLGETEGYDAHQICQRVRRSVDAFADGVAQFDDITMLTLIYHGDPDAITLPADKDAVAKVTAFVDEKLEAWGCPPKVQMQIDLAVEEIVVNVASYAYPKGEGRLTVRVQHKDDSVEMTFTDSGVPYDPTKKPDPDVTLSAQERGIGGLGIYLVKKLMDETYYEYRDGKNVLRLRKSLHPEGGRPAGGVTLE